MSGSNLLIGGCGFLGSAIADHLAALGREVTTVDRRPAANGTARHLERDLLVDDLDLPVGDVILTAGSSQPRVRHPWTIVLDNVITTARLLPQLAGRHVVLASSVETMGRAPGADQPGGLPISDDELRAWCARAVQAAAEPCPPWRVASLCRELVDPQTRWTYGLAKRAQELLLERLAPEDVRIVRLANLFGPGQDRVISRLARRATAGLPLRVSESVRCFVPVADAARAIAEADGSGVTALLGSPLSLPRVAELVQEELRTTLPVVRQPAPVGDMDGAALATAADRSPESIVLLEKEIRAFVRGLDDVDATRVLAPIPVVIPPRPDRPDVLAERHQASLWSGQVKHGNHWTRELTAALRAGMGLDDDRALVLCASGTAALRLAVVATVGMARPGDVAVVPSFTFPATAEALIQLGFRLRFVDVDPLSWTMDPTALETALGRGGARVVVSVDTLGAPADYDALNRICAKAGVPLVADSAPALGARYRHRPVGTQAAAHAYSMSFAKVVSAGGTGGALVLPSDRLDELTRSVDWFRSAQLGELPAATALDQALHLDELVHDRNEIAEVYNEFAATRNDIRGQHLRPDDRHAWVHWVARFTDVDRDELQRELHSRGIESKPYYAPALHRHDWAGRAEDAVSLPVTAALDREALALPMSSELTVEDAERVVGALVSALAAARRRTTAYRGRPAPRAWPAHVHSPIAPATTSQVAG